MELRVRVLNIVLFPVSVAANFVTLSWNTSQSLARDYLLQVHAAPTARCADTAYRQYNNIEVSPEQTLPQTPKSNDLIDLMLVVKRKTNYAI